MVREQADVEVSAVGGEAELQRIFIDAMMSGDGSLVDLVISGYRVNIITERFIVFYVGSQIWFTEDSVKRS